METIETINYDLSKELLPNHILDINQVQTSFNHAFSREEDDMKLRYLNYGISVEASKGDELCRKQISEFYTKQTGSYYSKDNIVLNYSVISGLESVLLSTLSKNDKVLVEVPTNPQCFELIENLNFEIIPYKRINNELDLENLEKVIIENNIKGMYTCSSFSDPLGTSLDDKTCRGLTLLAKKHKFYIYSDESNNLLSLENSEISLFFDREQDPKNYDYSNHSEYIISINSFEKFIPSQMKIGFILAHQKVIGEVLKKAFYIATNFNMNQHTIRSYLELGYSEKNLEMYKKICTANRNILISKLTENESIGINVVKPQGGGFIWVELDQNVDLTKLNQKKETSGINFVFGNTFVPSQFKLSDEFSYLNRHLRLSYSYLSEKDLQIAGEKLVKLISECQ